MSMEQGQENIPEGVKDIEAYNIYKSLKEHPLLNDKRKVITSDDNLIVDLLSRRTEDITRHLPEEERQAILSLHKVCKTLSTKMSNYKRQAYGIVGSMYNPTSFLDGRKVEVLELFGKLHSAAEVHKICISDWGLDVSYNTVIYFRNNHLEEIKALQESHKRDYTDLRLGYKKSRLEELSWMYNERKQIYQLTQSERDYKLLITTIAEIRKEIEGERVTFDGQVNVNIENTLNIHINQEILQRFSVMDIILSRVAAKTGKDPMFLMHKLHQSYYSKFSGFSLADKDINSDSVVYPSSMIYNLNEIEKQNAIKKEQEGQMKILPPMSEDKIEVAKSIKDLLKEKLMIKSQSVKNIEINVDKHKKE